MEQQQVTSLEVK